MGDSAVLLARLLDGMPVRRRDLELEIETRLDPEAMVTAGDVVDALLELHRDRIVRCSGGQGDVILAAPAGGSYGLAQETSRGR